MEEIRKNPLCKPVCLLWAAAGGQALNNPRFEPELSRQKTGLVKQCRSGDPLLAPISHSPRTIFYNQPLLNIICSWAFLILKGT